MNEVLESNRVILCHFDTYSTALLFARYGGTVLAPSSLPQGCDAVAAPEDVAERHSPAAALSALVERFELDAKELDIVERFQQWNDGPSGPIRIHLARFNTFEAPRKALEPQGGVFKPISEMRGLAMTELNLLRQAFNLIMGGA